VSKKSFDTNKENLRVFIYNDSPKSSKTYGNTNSNTGGSFTFGTGYSNPFISIDTSHMRGTGKNRHTVTLHGYISPDPAPADSTDSLLQKQKSLRDTFAQGNNTIEINDINGSNISRFTRCNLSSLRFEEGILVGHSEYVAVFETYQDNLVSSSTDLQLTWNKDMGFPTDRQGNTTSGYYRATITQSVSYTDKYHDVDSYGSIIYIDETQGGTLTDVNNPNATAYETYRQSSSSTRGGTEFYESKLTEEFILKPTSSTEYTLTDHKVLVSFSSGETSSVNNVFGGATVGGKILGLSNIGQAHAYFDEVCYSTASHIVPDGYNSSAVSTSKASNDETRTITFNYEYNVRPANSIDNAKVEKIETKWTGMGDAFSVIPVIGRAHGPILQNAFGKTERKKEITIEVLFNSIGKTAQADSDIQALIDAARPKTNIVFDNPRSEMYNSTERRYFTNASWVYEP